MSMYENLLSHFFFPENIPIFCLGKQTIVAEWELSRAICPALQFAGGSLEISTTLPIVFHITLCILPYTSPLSIPCLHSKC